MVKNRSMTIWSELQDEDIMNLSAKSMLEAPTPNDDIWQKFALPMTPPSSPRSYGESSDSDDVLCSSTCNIAERLHDVCEILDGAFDIHDTTEVLRNDVMTLRSKLISDCMWSGNSSTDITRYLLSTSYLTDKRNSIDADADLYPTPCPSPPPSVSPTAECPTSAECVDPTYVFPSCNLSDVPSSGVSESDEEIDVVTVDIQPPVLGCKRKAKSHNIVVHAKVNTNSSCKRSKSSPAKFHVICSTEEEHGKKRKLVSVTPVEDSTSEYDDRRASHNVLERKRRIDLKRSFEKLRDIIPMGSLKQDKAPKVVVLKKAALHVAELASEEQCLLKEKEQLQSENIKLLQMLRRLKTIVV